jgi:antitoxin ParD1/3/4
MTITLTPDQQAWLEAQVRSGSILSVEDAVRAAVAGMMTIEHDDFSWAKADVDEARSSLSRGEGIAGTEFLSRLDRLISTLESQ